MSGQQSLGGLDTIDSGTFTIVFDGGSKGNPGRGYGSFRLYGPNGDLAHSELTYDHLGNRITNNQAEYLTLIGALEKLSEILGDRAVNAEVIVNGDSLLVINQLLGSWKVRKAELQPLHRRASELLRKFGRRQLVWHDRSNSVRILGH